jgi:hypothetical protein
MSVNRIATSSMVKKYPPARAYRRRSAQPPASCSAHQVVDTHPGSSSPSWASMQQGSFARTGLCCPRPYFLELVPWWDCRPGISGDSAFDVGLDALMNRS